MTARDTDDRDLDETLDETFPASDAPANRVETGIRVDAPPTAAAVTDDHREVRRFRGVFRHRGPSPAPVHQPGRRGGRGRALGVRREQSARVAPTRSPARPWRG